MLLTNVHSFFAKCAFHNKITSENTMFLYHSNLGGRAKFVNHPSLHPIQMILLTLFKIYGRGTNPRCGLGLCAGIFARTSRVE